MGSYIKAPPGAFLLAVNYSTCTGKYPKGNQSMATITTPAADGTTVLATAATASATTTVRYPYITV